MYTRVSTDEQDPANQMAELLELGKRRDFNVDRSYAETVSGAARGRPELDRLMADASARKFDVVLVWALDRLGRRMGDTVARVLELERLGLDLISAREPWLDTSGPVRSLLVSVFAWVAEFERRRLVERTNAGLARARAKGVKLGRPKKHVAPHALRELVERGASNQRMARALGCSIATVKRLKKGLRSATS
jgi:DNA invertase Pin-like site-specific DNA recombinase